MFDRRHTIREALIIANNERIHICLSERKNKLNNLKQYPHSILLKIT